MKNYFRMENGNYGSYISEDCTEEKSEDAGLREVGNSKNSVLNDIKGQIKLIDAKVAELEYLKETLIADVMDLAIE